MRWGPLSCQLGAAAAAGRCSPLPRRDSAAPDLAPTRACPRPAPSPRPSLDALTLVATGWVIFSLRFPLKESYQRELDSTNPFFVALPCLALAALAHPSTRHFIVYRVRACRAAGAGGRGCWKAAGAAGRRLGLLEGGWGLVAAVGMLWLDVAVPTRQRAALAAHRPRRPAPRPWPRSCGPSACTWRR